MTASEAEIKMFPCRFSGGQKHKNDTKSEEKGTKNKWNDQIIS